MSGKVWWVNQGGTYELSRAGGYLWAPILDARGIEQPYRRTMTEVRKGDIIVHCAHGTIWAISRAISEAYPAGHPRRPPAAQCS
jgi:5-methylcytosine-specific restriction protein B